MKLLKEEQEVCITFDKIGDNAKLYTSDPSWIRKMDKMCEKNEDLFKCIKRDDVSATYEFPKKNVSIRKGNAKIELTEEEREIRRLRAEKALKAKNSKNKDFEDNNDIDDSYDNDELDDIENEEFED